MKTEEKPDYLGHRSRLRERFMRGEGRNMADYELLELLLTYALPRRDVKPIAKDLIRKFGSLAGVVNADESRLTEIPGIKENTAVLLKLVKQAASRFSWQNLSGSDAPVISCWDAMIDYCRSEMGYLDIEEFRLIFLDVKFRLLGEEIMQRGTINQVAIHPREVVRLAMEKNAAAVIMAHNHPSGDVKPSHADIEITRQIDQALKSINIQLIDHIIISRSGYYSIKTLL